MKEYLHNLRLRGKEFGIHRNTEAADRTAELEAALQAVADELRSTGGEYWMGTAEVPAVLQQMYDQSGGTDE